ncbi:MAG TPA: hypothetical protein VFO05_01530 [Candidatus Limnocylindrales bacterium]|nr:hypothetical protein [Candidatus Limnocylindrales bacterium]
MTGQLNVDQVLEDWLAEGPDRLPDRVITSTVAQLDDIKQRKSSWLPGRDRMYRLILPATGVAAAIVIAAVALTSFFRGPGVGGPPGTPFTSDRHGYTTILSEGWTVEERPGSWPLGTFFDANTDSGVDSYQRLDADQGPRLNLYLASQPIPTGMSFDEWAATHDDANEREHPCFELVATYSGATVAGEPARQQARHCETFFGEGDDGALTGIQTLVSHNGRGYAIYLWPEDTGVAMPPLSALRAEAQAWLTRFTFTD